MAEESGCHLLLDVNNVYVSCYNHRLDPSVLYRRIAARSGGADPSFRPQQQGTHIIDTHDDHVADEVWALYRYVVTRRAAYRIRWWNGTTVSPDFPVLLAELEKAKHAAADAHVHAPLSGSGEAASVCRMRKSRSRIRTDENAGGDFLPRYGSEPTGFALKERFPPATSWLFTAHAYRYRLIDTTAEDYPVLKSYLGDDRFDRLIADFVETVRSDHFNIGRYAAKLPAFIATQADCDPFAQELCALECALSQLAIFPRPNACLQSLSQN